MTLTIGKLYSFDCGATLVKDHLKFYNNDVVLRIPYGTPATVLILDYIEDSGVWVKVLHKDTVGWICVADDESVAIAFINRRYQLLSS